MTNLKKQDKDIYKTSTRHMLKALQNMSLQMNSIPLPLHLTHINKQTIIINRLYILFHSIALTVLIYYRLSSILTLFNTRTQPLTPHVLIFFSEVMLSFIWLLSQSFFWRPITRTVFPERLPQDDQLLPSIDVFICTADPIKEPPLGVMNTVVSAMSLNYPSDKVSVYLSDDAGCSGTLEAMHEAYKFAMTWVPFCKKFGVKTICPEAYFAGPEVDEMNSHEFGAEKLKVKESYKLFTQKMAKISESQRCISNNDHSAIVKVMVDESTDDQEQQMPRLVYVSREKKPSQPHHFKAGALNALFRVSGLISNSPYILGLDCDMYCNDRNSAREAMCFHLDPQLSSLAFVQFPQRFHNISKHDIYESGLRTTFTTLWRGMDGIKGPCLAGTCYYLKRKPVYGLTPVQEDIDIKELRQSFGSSNEFIKSVQNKCNAKLDCGKILSDELLQETKLLASCEYENDTKWGIEVGFRYFSVVEDYLTSFNMHTKNWESIFYMPSRPSFLGSGTTSLNDTMIQGTRWCTGALEVALSKFSPLIYGQSRMPTLQRFCYARMSLFPLNFIPLWILATVPQLSLLNDITIYPELQNPFAFVFLYVFVLSNLQHMREIYSTGEPLKTWKYEQRIWMMKGITTYLYGSIHAMMEKFGAKEASFLPTNKVIDDDQVKLYQMGIYNFQTSSMFVVPLCSLVILNLLAFVVGMLKITIQREYIGTIFIQTLLSFYVSIMGYPVLEGMILRKDKGRIEPRMSFYSVALSIIILFFGSFLVIYY